MTCPLSRKEISKFLQVDERLVEGLWRSGKLKRSIENEHRPTHDLRHSDSYDLLEYLLVFDRLPTRLSRCTAELWVEKLTEVLDLKEFKTASTSEIALTLSRNAIHDRLCANREKSEEIALLCISVIQKIESFCVEADRSFQENSSKL